MPNRILKESICTSDTIDSLSPEEEVFFYRLLVQCDDYGRMDARLSILRSKIFPLKLERYSELDICNFLSKLITTRLIIVYLVEEKPFLQVITWDKHQQIRAHKSKYPEHANNDNHLLSPDSIRNLLPAEIIGNHLQSNVTVIQSNPIQSKSESNQVSKGVNPLLSQKEGKKKDFELPDWIDKETWNAYAESRKKIKAPMTDKAISLIIKDLAELKDKGNDPNLVLEQSIKRGWRGVFHLKCNDEKKNMSAQKEKNYGDNGHGNGHENAQLTNEELRRSVEEFKG